MLGAAVGDGVKPGFHHARASWKPSFTTQAEPAGAPAEPTAPSGANSAPAEPATAPRTSLVPVVEDVDGQGVDAADHHDRSPGPEQPPGRADGQRDAAHDEAGDDDGDRHPGGGTAVVRLVHIRLPDVCVKPARSRISRVRHGPWRRLIGHGLLLSSVPLLLFSGKCETYHQPDPVEPYSPQRPLARPGVQQPYRSSSDSVWCLISPTMTCGTVNGSRLPVTRHGEVRRSARSATRSATHHR